MIATEQRQVKIAIMGPSGAGKTHALRVLMGKEPPTRGTVGAEVVPYLVKTTAGENVKANIWDCSGAKTYERLVAIHIQRSDFLLVFYSPYKAESLQSAKGWVQLIAEKNYSKEKVWVVRCLRNDEDYRIQEQGKAHFEKAGYKHVDLKNYVQEDVAKLISDAIEAIPAPENKPQPSVEDVLHGIDFGDVVFDAEWLGKYINILEQEEKDGATPEATAGAEKQRSELIEAYQKKFSGEVPRDNLPAGHPKGLKGECPFTRRKLPFWGALVATLTLAGAVFTYRIRK